MKLESTFSIVVLPTPVPPEIRTLSLPRTQLSSMSTSSGVIDPEIDEVIGAERFRGELADRQYRTL